MRRSLLLRLALLGAVGLAACERSPAPPSSFPDRLSATGLYRDPLTLELAPDVVAFEVAHALWSDGATKRRWIRLPAGAQIDTSDMDHWQFPVGTRVWKEFSRDGVALETRMIVRVYETGNPEVDFRMGSYLWLPDHSDAVFTPEGAPDVHGTTHDVPSVTLCWRCHHGEPGHLLGFSAVQLSRADLPVTVASLAAAGRLSHPPGSGEPYTPPGDAVTALALGTLHANCSHCHNPNGNAWPQTTQVLRLSVGERRAEDTRIYRETVGVPLQYWRGAGLQYRVVPGDPDQSGLFYRMSHRGDPLVQMPPVATELLDPAGLTAVRAWISALP